MTIHFSPNRAARSAANRTGQGRQNLDALSSFILPHALRDDNHDGDTVLTGRYVSTLDRAAAAPPAMSLGNGVLTVPLVQGIVWGYLIPEADFGLEVLR